jgi:acyl dehydratase
MPEADHHAPASAEWDRAKALVGTEIGHFAGADAVSMSDIRRRLEVLAWDCPLHYDEATAQAHGYRTVVAPASMYMTFAMPRYWEPGMPRPDAQHRYLPDLPMVTNLPGEGDGLFDTDFEVHYHEPMYPGDRISGASRILSVTPKRLSVGAGAFIVVESAFTNQHGGLVAVDRVTLFRYTPEPNASGTGGAVVAVPAPAAPGEQIPAFTVPLTVQLLVMEAAVNRDLSSIHHDAAAARDLGAPDMFAGVLLLQAIYEAAARQWLGPAGQIERIGFRMRAFNCPGDMLSCRASVRDTKDEGKSARTVLTAWTESQRGITTHGEMTVRTPAGRPPT